MTDRRQLWANERVAHVSLRDTVPAPHYTQGAWHSVGVCRTPLLSAPDGGREREAIFGERFLVLEMRDGFAFGALERDGYVGYVALEALHKTDTPASHVITAPRSYAKPSPQLKSFEPLLDLPFGARLGNVTIEGDWAGFDLPGAPPQRRFLPAKHIAPIGQVQSDPVKIARLFLGTPYLWGGNSAFGIDCSGLVQASLLACAIPCPGDSDQQAAQLGDLLPPDADFQAADLLFWPGHVAMVATPETLIHATAYAMQVIEEPLRPALARIEATETGPVTAHRRVG